MAAISESMANLRFYGDDLNPDEITELLGAVPDRAFRKGDVISTKTSGQERIARTGTWQIRATDHKPEDLNGQIEELLSPLNKDLSVWRRLAKYRPNLFVGLFMEETNEGAEISARCLSTLGDRGIELGLDIYDPTRRMNSVQVIDGAGNATFSVFQATDKEFKLIYPGDGQDMEIVEDFVERVGVDSANEVLNAI